MAFAANAPEVDAVVPEFCRVVTLLTVPYLKPYAVVVAPLSVTVAFKVAVVVVTLPAPATPTVGTTPCTYTVLLVTSVEYTLPYLLRPTHMTAVFVVDETV